MGRQVPCPIDRFLGSYYLLRCILCQPTETDAESTIWAIQLHGFSSDEIGMLNRIPKQLPPLGQMLANIGHPSAAELAQALGISARTARGWMAANAAPRPACIALFWLTTWGQSAVQAEAVNLMQMHAAMSRAARIEADTLRAQLADVIACADFGSANSPVFLPGTRQASNPATRSGRAS